MNSEKIANFIKKIRKDNNLTQQDLADKYGVTYQAVSKWENGKNLPDIMLLKEICKDYNVSIDELLDAKEKKNFSLVPLILVFIGVILIFFGVFLIFNHDHPYNSRSIESMCDEFKITGNIAYDKDKSSIYIYKVDYCGKKDETIYQNIDCALYEKNNGKDKLIKECKNNMQNVTLDDYLEDVSIVIDDYNQTCRNMDDYELYLKINAKEKDNKTVTYDIPLALNESCKK
jgi:transcriptional regulator with XRE-family HTH domain